MDSLFVIANLAAQSSLHRTAYSALPDAPVQPVVARRRPLRRLLGGALTLVTRVRNGGRSRAASQPGLACPSS